MGGSGEEEYTSRREKRTLKQHTTNVHHLDGEKQLFVCLLNVSSAILQ